MWLRISSRLPRQQKPKEQPILSHIVIIEDKLSSDPLASKILRRAGHKVTLAEDGEMGLTTILDAPPDLILIDFALSDMDGQTVIALLRQEISLNDIPIIAFTAWPQTTVYTMAQAYGCNGVISKPIDPYSFADQVANYLEYSKASS